MSTLNLFPARVPIGHYTYKDKDGRDQQQLVLASPEFIRALSDLFTRVGGTTVLSNDDLALLTFQAMLPLPDALGDAVAALEMTQPVDQGASIAEIRHEMDELRLLTASAQSAVAELAAMRASLQEVAMMAGYRDPYRIDWERPGKIGFVTANTGAFTTLAASAAVALNPANANVVISPTGTGVVTISPAAAGSINNMNIGAVTRGTLAATSGAFNAGVTVSGGTLTTLGGATFHTTSTALTNGAAAAAGTLANAPAAGNPTKWIGINDNGTTRYIPAW